MEANVTDVYNPSHISSVIVVIVVVGKYNACTVNADK